MDGINYIICLKKGKINTYLGWDGTGFTFLDKAKLYDNKEEAEHIMENIDKSQYSYDIDLLQVDIG